MVVITDRKTSAVAGGLSGFIISLIVAIAAALFQSSPTPSPEPTPEPQPEEVVVVDDVRFVYVEDSKGEVLDDSTAAKLIAATDVEHGAYSVIKVGKRTTMIPIVIGGSVPPSPEPVPDPDPQPEPKPTPKELWGVVVEESADRTPQQAALMASRAFRELFPVGHLRIVDVSTEASDGYESYRKQSQGRDLPLLYLVDPQGNIFYDDNLPATTAELAGIIQKIKGEK